MQATTTRSEQRRQVVPYPDIAQHGVIGDRRTAALVAADGTVDWLCCPDFDSGVIFGALLDWSKGGHWRLGPARMVLGAQNYEKDTMVLETRWDLPEGQLLLQDVMLWPEAHRSPDRADRRVLVRSLRCERGKVRCELDLQARFNFEKEPELVSQSASGFTLELPGALPLRLWAEPAPGFIGPHLHRDFELKEGESYTAVLDIAGAGGRWSAESVRTALEESRRYWRDWLGQIRSVGQADSDIQRAAMTVHLLTYAPGGSVVAAPTTSLPERIGGGWNVDYRLCWVRDASLSVGMLARLGHLHETEQYLQWITRQVARFGQPLQVLYGIRGETRPRQEKLSDVSGYRDSKPVRLGNHAYKQRQLGSYGYLADCVWVYLEQGGQWRDEYWNLIQRLANYTAKHWQDTENGIWELPERRQYLSSKVLNWVTMERAIRIARKYRPEFDTSTLRSVADAIHAEVMDRGWSERLGAFRQHYDADTLDASGLLVSVLDFLPSDHPRVLATIDRTAEFLTIDGFVYRFDPLNTPGLGQLPMGELEGAFLPATFWLATAYAKSGRADHAEELLAQVEKIVGPLHLFSEAIDARSKTFLGNTPLLFSHVEYVRARLEIARVRQGVPR